MGLYPNMMYRLVPGLVALFGRASLRPSNPRAPLIRSCVASGFSYFAVAMHPAENGRGSRGSGNLHWVVGSASDHGSGQGSVFRRGGFPSVNQGFNLGYVSRGRFSSYGRGWFGGRGWSGGWAAQP
jgi:hypothetical protein